LFGAAGPILIQLLKDLLGRQGILAKGSGVGVEGKDGQYGGKNFLQP
jgi:hypothetical protein